MGLIKHWTYKDTPNPSCLEQGDILKSSELKNILKEIHPYYDNVDSYPHLMITTQSCDLVRRHPHPKEIGEETCKARYITLAPVRNVNIVIQRKLESIQGEFERLGELCGQKRKTLISDFIERLLNNNEEEYFYLHEDACAFLRLSIGIRAYEHYNTCLEARILSLKEIFQAKLGWKIGHMYSRVGTEDWPQEELGKIVDKKVDSLCKWVYDGWKLVGDGFNGDNLFAQIRSVSGCNDGKAMWGTVVGNKYEFMRKSRV